MKFENLPLSSPLARYVHGKLRGGGIFSVKLHFPLRLPGEHVLRCSDVCRLFSGSSRDLPKGPVKKQRVWQTPLSEDYKTLLTDIEIMGQNYLL